jgi:uncharacterized membrane protein YgcG
MRRKGQGSASISAVVVFLSALMALGLMATILPPIAGAISGYKAGLKERGERGSELIRIYIHSTDETEYAPPVITIINGWDRESILTDYFVVGWDGRVLASGKFGSVGVVTAVDEATPNQPSTPSGGVIKVTPSSPQSQPTQPSKPSQSGGQTSGGSAGGWGTSSGTGGGSSSSNQQPSSPSGSSTGGSPSVSGQPSQPAQMFQPSQPTQASQLTQSSYRPPDYSTSYRYDIVYGGGSSASSSSSSASASSSSSSGSYSYSSGSGSSSSSSGAGGGGSSTGRSNYYRPPDYQYRGVAFVIAGVYAVLAASGMMGGSLDGLRVPAGARIDLTPAHFGLSYSTFAEMAKAVKAIYVRTSEGNSFGSSYGPPPKITADYQIVTVLATSSATTTSVVTVNRPSGPSGGTPSTSSSSSSSSGGGGGSSSGGGGGGGGTDWGQPKICTLTAPHKAQCQMPDQSPSGSDSGSSGAGGSSSSSGSGGTSSSSGGGSSSGTGGSGSGGGRQLPQPV